MALNFEDFIEQVRDANPIELVIEESGVRLRGHGRLRTGAQHDSLKVRTDMQRAFWYSQNWHGDVFGWVMKEKGCEFMEAVRILAQRVHIEMPKFQAVNEGEVRRARATADAFSVAAAAFALNRSAGAREMATSALKFGKSKMQGGFFKPRHVAGQEDVNAADVVVWATMLVVSGIASYGVEIS